MTANLPNPDPADVPNLAPGGGVDPGDTPPDSGQTSATANKDPKVGKRMTPTAVITIIAVGVIVLIFVAVAVVYIGNIVGS
jgi:hypothetical protein